MKRVLFFSALLLILSGFITEASALVYVRGYTKSNGTYVEPHYRTNPDGIKSNNFSYWR